MAIKVVGEDGNIVTVEDESGKRTPLDTSSMDEMQKAAIRALPRMPKPFEQQTPAERRSQVVKNLPVVGPLVDAVQQAGEGAVLVGKGINAVIEPFRDPRPDPAAEADAIAAAAARGQELVPQSTPVSAPTIPPVTNYLAGAARALSDQQGKVVEGAAAQQRKLDEAFAAQEEAIQTGQVIGAQHAEEEAAYRKRTAEIQARDAAVARENEQMRQQFIKAERDKYEMLSNQIASAKAPVFTQSTGAKIGSMIAGALMALGAGLNRQDQSVGIRWFQGVVEEDLQRQRMELELKKDRRDVQGNILAMTRSMFDDERTAEAAARALKWQGIEQELQAVLAKQKSGTMQAKATEALASVAAQKAAALSALDQSTNQQVTGILNTRANIAAQQDQMSAARAAAAQKGAGGKPPERLSENTIKGYKELEAELKQLQNLKKRFYEDTGPLDSVGASSVPYTSGRAYQAARAFAESRLINRLTGAGVGIEEAKRLAGLLPSAGTMDVDADEQWKSLEDELILTMQGLREGYSKSGYDVSGLSPVGNVSSFQKP